MKRSAEKRYFDKETEKANGNSDKMWKVIKKATRQKTKPDIVPDFVKVLTAEGIFEKIEQAQSIANEMNSQFARMGANLADDLQPTTSLFF